MFWNPAPRVDKVVELLKNGDPPLIEVLDQDSISSSIRNSSNTILFDYLSRQDNMEELLKWALTDEYKDHKKYAKLANAAVTIFSGSKPFQQIILENQFFLDRIKEFTTSKPPSSRSCGHYLRIIESIANGTKGAILSKLSDFPDFLINNITDMALKDLFVLMSTEFTQPFGFNTELLIKLVSTINNENCLFVVSAIRDIISNNSDLKKEYFDSNDLIDHLFKSATETAISQPLLSTELFRLLKDFNDLDNYNSVLLKYSQTFEYQINLSLPFQVQVFGKLTQPLFDEFFDPKSCSLLVEAIYQSFIKKSEEERCELAKNANLRQKIIESFPKSTTNARIADLAEDIFKNLKDSPENDQEFKSFYEKDIDERLKLRNSKYGGKVMNSDEEDEDIDEEDDSDNHNNGLFNKNSDSEESYEEDTDDDENEDEDESPDEDEDESPKEDFTKARKINNNNNESNDEKKEDNQEETQKSKDETKAQESQDETQQQEQQPQ